MDPEFETWARVLDCICIPTSHLCIYVSSCPSISETVPIKAPFLRFVVFCFFELWASRHVSLRPGARAGWPLPGVWPNSVCWLFCSKATPGFPGPGIKSPCSAFQCQLLPQPSIHPMLQPHSSLLQLPEFPHAVPTSGNALPPPLSWQTPTDLSTFG